MRNALLFAFFTLSIIMSLAILPLDNSNAEHFHSSAELALFEQMKLGKTDFTDPENPNLLIDSNILFPTSRTCSGCHGHDPNMHAFITSSLEDVNIYDDWRSTMMANSAKDPFWRAKVSHEILINPTHSNELQDKCTSCHAPAGHYQAKLHDKAPHYLLSDLYTDTLGLDGVTCQICHAQSPELLGSLHSGNLNFDTNHIRVAYGPYKFVFAPPMHNFVGITPIGADHILDAGLCAGCHTLITSTADLQGNLTGNTYVEQATYHEWLNSRYDRDHDNISCQKCHIPQLQDAIVISANYAFLTGKFPFGKHELSGANVQMLRLLRDNREKLGITAEAVQFDSTIASTLRMLQQQSLTTSLNPVDLNGDTIAIDLKLTNRAGHKFPSGYPSRRAWIEFVLKDYEGNIVFQSGRYNPDYSLPDEDANVEPHYNVISSPDQVQIYEIVPADVNGAFTNVLEQAAFSLKDNRLTPQGFKSSDVVYDTTLVVGVGNDPDFNRLSLNSGEGTGGDLLHFRIPNTGFSGYLRAEARVWYQSLPPKWMAPLFAYSTPEIDSFRQMFNAADQSPVLVSEQVLDSLLVSTVSVQDKALATFGISVFPSVTTQDYVHLRVQGNARITRVKVWDAQGRLWSDGPAPNGPLPLPAQKGVYFIAVDSDKGKVVKKVLRQ